MDVRAWFLEQLTDDEDVVSLGEASVVDEAGGDSGEEEEVLGLRS